MAEDNIRSTRKGNRIIKKLAFDSPLSTKGTDKTVTNNNLNTDIKHQTPKCTRITWVERWERIKQNTEREGDG